MTLEGTHPEVRSDPLRLDFLADWAGLMAQYLVFHGETPTDTDAWKLTAAVLNFERLDIPPRPRHVFRADSLRVSVEVDRFLRLVENGHDLNAHQSKHYRATFSDILLNDIGARHFHLTEPGRKRQDDLLFAIVKNDAFYALAVLGHRTFREDDLTEIVHRNWPGLIARYRAVGAVPGSLRPAGGAARGALRGRGFTTGIQVSDGTIYMPTGGGFVVGGLEENARGLSLSVVRKANEALEYLVNLQQATDDARDRLAVTIGGPDKRLLLAYRNGDLFGFSTPKATAIRLGDAPFRLRFPVDHWLTAEPTAGSPGTAKPARKTKKANRLR